VTPGERSPQPYRYLQGPLELLDREGEWAARHGMLRKRSFWGAIYDTKAIFLPRQARDKHGKKQLKTKTTTVFLGVLYFWPYTKGGKQQDPNELIITAPVEQQVISFVGKSQQAPVTGVALSNLRVVGSSMPLTYVYMCHGDGSAGIGGGGAACASTGGPDTPDETNTSPRSAR
jgi:hypothetical protein